MKYRHLIISRLAIKWYNRDGELRCEKELDQSWESWLASTINLYSTYTRESLRKQSNQNFTLISVVDESVNDIGELLPNEVVLKIKEVKDLVPELTKFIDKEYNSPLYLMSRIDRDDCFGVTYVEELQKMADGYLTMNDSPQSVYFDIADLNMYDPNRVEFVTRAYPKNATSPFTSTLTNNPSPIIYRGHGRIKDKMTGFKSSKLDTLQIIHGENLANTMKGKPINENVYKRLMDFGIMKNTSFMIDRDLYLWIKKTIPKGSTILELGSGYGTIALSEDYKMISIENDPRWIGLADSRYIYAPIVNKWYDPEILKKELLTLEYDVIIVDGPWIGVGNRYGFVDNIDLFKKNITIIFDDTHREDEKFMCEYFSNEVNRPYKEFIGDKKNFSVILNARAQAHSDK